MKMWKDLLIMAVFAAIILSAVGVVIANLGPAASLGRVFYLVADANCVQTDYNPSQITFPYDPNQVAGHLIGVIECTAGIKFNQEGDWCDTEGDPVTITLASSPAWVSLTVRPETRQFTLAGEVPMPGVYYIVLQLVDAPVGGSPEQRTATVIVHAHTRPNTAPSVRLLQSL